MVDQSTEKKGNGEEKETEEAHAYTPGLKVKKSTIVEKMRRLPLLGDVYPKVGDKVNIETDLIGKYVERMLRPGREDERERKGGGGVSLESLAKSGFL